MTTESEILMGIPAKFSVALFSVVLEACGRGDGAPKRETGGSGTGSNNVAVAPDPRSAVLLDTASDAGAQVARRIVKASTLEDAVTATREAITRGGLTVTDFQGTVQRPVGKPSPFVVLPPEAVLLAYEARQHATQSRLTLDELGNMLSDFGWPFHGEAMPGDQLMRIIATWVREARKNPEDPVNFTPLFLADMGRRQIPAVDLANDSTDPGEVRLGFLELQLFAAALTRGLGKPVKIGRIDATPVILASYGTGAGVGVCDGAKEWFNGTLVGGLTGEYGAWGVGEALERGLKRAGLTVLEAAFGPVTDAAEAVMKIVRLAELYGSIQLDIDYASETPAERPGPGEDKYAAVIARAGVNAQDYEQYQKSLKSNQLVGSVRNCLETLGLPTWSDLGEVASDADKWRIQWTLGRGSPKHALHAREHNDWAVYGQRKIQLKRASPTSGEAKYTFKLTPEALAGHPGHRLRSEVEVTAQLDMVTAPAISTITDILQDPVIGRIKSSVELGVGAFKVFVTPEAHLFVPIVYHEPGIPFRMESDGAIRKGPILLRGRDVYDGSIYLGEDSLWHGQVAVWAGGTLSQSWIPPYCQESYDGVQVFEVEGSFRTGPDGKDQVELAFIPSGPPEYYTVNGNCSREKDMMNGIETIPLVTLLWGFEPVVVIDPPVEGQQRVYRTGDLGEGHTLTVITVGANFGE